ncbi:MAG: HAMP domain-containing protein [Deltaproteobacteria bacterium]|nr:HAMP domain-containing protein [Deltaproteobacteria bacterium]
MKLARKLTLTLLLGIWGVLGVHAFFEVAREETALEEDVIDDLRIIGRALKPALVRLWQREGQVLAMQVLEYDEEMHRRVRIRWVSLSAPEGDPHHPLLRPRYLRRVARGEEVSWLSDPDAKGESRAYVYIPIMLDPLPPGALELSESLAPPREFLRETVIRLGITTGAMALVSGLVALLVGVYFVGRPMRRLAERARRIGEGELTGRLELTQDDEIGELAHEMNAMSDRLSEAQDSIERETQARIQALEALRHADRLMTVGKLASGIAHELGTPLNVVAGRARMIQDPGCTPEEAQVNARIIVEQSERITKIIRQLLDFARRRGPQKAPVSVLTLARQTLQLLRPMAQKRQVATAVEGPEDLPPVEVDANQIQQVLTNLAVNAIQATPESGGTLVVTVHPVQATPPPGEDAQPGAYLRIDVTDSGHGIRPEDLGRIFEPFYTTKDVGEGTGLGLSVAYGIVREHGGWITVHSQPGQGSTFSVFLPRS